MYIFEEEPVFINEPGIYEIYNKANGKRYVGQSVRLKNRLQTHFRRLLKNEHPNRHLQASWNKYGEHLFSFEPIEYCDVSELDKKESYYIKLFNANSNHKGYNIRIDSTSNRGIKWTEEQRERYKELSKNFYYLHNHTIPDWVRERSIIALKNKVWTDEERKRQSIRLTGTKVSDTSKMKIAQQGENNPSHKLTLEEVKQIKALLASKKYMSKEIAKQFGVKSTTISAINSERSWNNVCLSNDEEYKEYLNKGIEKMGG